MARPKGATREKTLMRDAYKVSLLATAERAKSGDLKAQEMFLSAVGISGNQFQGFEVKASLID
jgi:hypothetical protein